ncbi:hypothetical protein WA158_002436 [Blastocystis sp. Blastoise]
MSLHILRHKLWHPWNQDNLEKVAKDEEEHAQEEKVLLEKDRQVQFEKKIEMMKARNKIDQEHVRNDDDKQNDSQISSETNRIILGDSGIDQTTYGTFNIPKADTVFESNQDYLKEKQEDHIKEMKKLGMANWRLKPFEKEALPWYASDPKQKYDKKGGKINDDDYLKLLERNEYQRKFEDPLYLYTEECKQKEKDIYKVYPKNEVLAYQAMNQPKDITTPTVDTENNKQSLNSKFQHETINHDSSKDREELKKHHHHKHSSSSHHRHHHSHSEQRAEDIKDDKQKLIEQLRKERIQRESIERKKATDLLLQHSGIQTKPKNRYFSEYHPEKK